MGVPSETPLYKPLLVMGKHVLTLGQIRTLCVDHFGHSTNRPGLYSGLLQFVDLLRDARISGKLWIDGSFLTWKQNPGDVDIVVLLNAHWIDELATDTQFERILWIQSDEPDNLGCHCFLLPIYPEGHENYGWSQERAAYWENWWSHERCGSEKGFIELVF